MLVRFLVNLPEVNFPLVGVELVELITVLFHPPGREPGDVSLDVIV